MNKWLKIVVWFFFVSGVFVLLYFSSDTLNKRTILEPEVVVHVDGENIFITEKELLSRLKRERLLFEGQKRGELDIEKIEAFINSISQVKSSRVFLRVDGSWKIDVVLRQPIARIFNTFNESFYLDSEGNTMHTTPSHTARILVVTGNIPDRKESISATKIINNDSLISIRKLDDIYRISDYVCKDPLFHSLIGQIHLEKSGDFILVTLVGDQKIVFGSAYSKKEVEEKFEKLRLFYEEALPYEGWNTYSEISLKFEDQIVCKKKKIDE